MTRALRVSLLLLLAVSLTSAVADARRRGRGRRGPGTLEINSMTEGATVQVDGQEIGTLPFPKPVPMAPGKHTLKITKKGYTEYLDVFTINPGKTTNLDIDLLPFAGVVKISANVEEARVFIDGKFVGTTPLENEMLIGKHSIRVRKAGFYDHIGSVQSIAGKTQQVKIKLKAMPVGTTPYRPPPPPPAKWYEKWYVWAGGAAAVAAITVAIVVPVVVSNKDPVGDFCSPCDFRWQGAVK